MGGVGIALGAISKGCGAPGEGVGLPARRSPAPSTAREVGWGLGALAASRWSWCWHWRMVAMRATGLRVWAYARSACLVVSGMWGEASTRW